MSKTIDIKRHHHAVPALAGTWRDFRQEIDRLFDRFSEGFDSVSLQPFTNIQKLFEPLAADFSHLSVDVAESDTSYAITAELPGVAEKDIEVSVSDDMLVISGEKRQEKEDKSHNRYISERSYGSFRRMFSLPAGTDADKIDAQFRNGILTVTVPKTAKQESRKVDIKAA